MLRLYDYFRSSASFRVRIALNLKNLPYEAVPVHLLNNGGEQFSAEYDFINPQHLVPALQEGEHVITQSLAIIAFLEEKYPSPALLPKDLYQRAFARSFALAIAADMHPLNNLRVLKFLTGELGLSEEQKMQWYRHWTHLGLTALEKKLIASQMVGEFCIGDMPTVADICLVPQLYNARRYECDLTAYPTLVRIDANCQALPAFKKAWPE